jgi:two-component system, sensor histidine kinase
VDTIGNAGQRLADLVNDILDFSKIEEGKMTIEHVPFSPALVVHEVIDLLAPKAKTKGLMVHFDNQIGNALTVAGDPTRVRQILLNLVSNSIKFTDTGSITVFGQWVASVENPGQGRLAFQIIDTGIGIAPAKLTKLFCMYSQADGTTARKFGGSGLGLAICKRLVELMGGSISVTSMEGRGSTFTFDLPAELAAETPESEHNDHTGGTAAPFQPEKRVLVVDDHELNRELLRLLLRRCGYESDLAATGDDAIRLVTQRSYVAVFMDLEMPGMDGYTVTAEIRRRERPDRRVPIVAVTAITHRGTRERCLASGMDEYLTKPVYVPAMKSTLKALIDRSSVPV